jgi:hypothetical protein
MAAAKRLDHHPRVKRTKPKPVVLGDDAEQVMLFYGLDERTYREQLFRDFVLFCRKHDGFVISQPWHSPAVILVRLGDGETSPLEKAMQALPRYQVTKLPGTTIRLSHGIFETMRQLQVQLWR